MKVVINRCYGGFGLSEAAYARLIELGIPVRQYVQQKRDPKTRLYLPEPLNDGEVIFDRDLDENPDTFSKAGRALMGRYWETWIGGQRNHPLLLQVVQELGKQANGRCAELEIVEIPDDVEWEIDEYDGMEHIAEKHRTWA